MSPTVNYHFLDAGKPFEVHNRQRSAFQILYGDYLSKEAALRGRVLDIGCGHGVNPTLERLVPHLGQLDGVDPFPAVTPPAHLVNRWSCKLEDIPVASETYDMAYSYNVVEHVENIDSFLSKTVDLLKPGGVYWSMSPNARHPFTWATRTAERLGLKRLYQRLLKPNANDYPAYYRLSSDTNILRAIKRYRLPVSRIDFYYLDCVQWDSYFPRPLHAIPHAIDRAFVLRRPKMGFIFIFRLQKDGGSA